MLETRQERVELLKTGISGKHVEDMYITGNNIKIIDSNLLHTGILDTDKELEIEKRTAESEEFSAKLEIAEKICACQDELKEIPFYKFVARSEIKQKIRELESKLQYEYERPLLDKFPRDSLT